MLSPNQKPGSTSTSLVGHLHSHASYIHYFSLFTSTKSFYWEIFLLDLEKFVIQFSNLLLVTYQIVHLVVQKFNDVYVNLIHL